MAAGSASAPAAAMMFLRPESSALVEELSKRLDPDHAPCPIPIPEIRITDFDGLCNAALAQTRLLPRKILRF